MTVNNKNFLILRFVLGLLLVGGFLGYYLYAKKPTQKLPAVSPGASHSVILTKDGFTPAEITIHQGDTVVFTTTAGQDFWPASDPHPTHEIYPEFDPKKPIAADKSWSFVFAKAGSWKYHNHLFFTQRGTINVVAAGTGAVPALNCGQDGQNPQCWQNAINDALNKQGLDAAFEVMANLYNTQPAFAAECHGYSHQLGQAAYQLFAQHKDFELTPKTAYCGYGFYHGFMETLLHTSGNIQEAKDFCAYVGKKLQAYTSDAEGACYHGIGHGTVDGGDPTAWGSPQKMLEPGMAMCKTVAGDDTSQFGKMYRCVSGAFNALEILSQDPKYQLTQIQNDPFYLCPSQPVSFQEACYTNMLPALLRFTGSDLLKAAKAVEAIKEVSGDFTIRSQVMLSLFHEFIRIHLAAPNYDVAQGVAMCRSLNKEMRLPCIQGLSGGHMKYGQPQQEYIKGLAFCGSSILHSDEAQTCYQYILPRLRIWYSLEKSNQICQSVPAAEQKYCSAS